MAGYFQYFKTLKSFLLINIAKATAFDPNAEKNQTWP